jgi:hypothetical protein
LKPTVDQNGWNDIASGWFFGRIVQDERSGSPRSNARVRFFDD